jgi:hypothetical protein
MVFSAPLSSTVRQGIVPRRFLMVEKFENPIWRVEHSAAQREPILHMEFAERYGERAAGPQLPAQGLLFVRESCGGA